MDELPDRTPSRLDRVRGHALVRAAVVFGSAIFFVLQVLDLLGVPAAAIRALAIVFAAGFVAGEGFYLWKLRGPAAATRAPERLRRWVLGGRRWASATLVLLVLGTSAWLLGRRLIGSPVRPGTDIIAVMPFVASGDDVEDLGFGMVSLLSTTLDQVGGLRTIDPGTVLHGWSRRAAGGTLDLRGALQVGRDVGAGAILWGSVSAVREAVQVTGEIYTLDGQRVAQRQERGDVDDLHTLIDRLSVQLLREIWRSDAPVPDLRIAAITTESPQALRAFLRGERYFRAARYDSAVTVFEEAVRADSMFALAYFRLSEAYGWSMHIGAEPALRAAEAANRLAVRLPARERALATAQLLHEKGDFAALDSVRAITRRHPDDALAWYLLGDVLVHSRVMLEPTADSLIAPFRRAVELDPTPSGGMIHMLEEALYRGDRPLFDEFLAHYKAAAGPERAGRWEQLARVRWVPADSLLPSVTEVATRFIQERAPVTYLGRSETITNIRFATEVELDPQTLIATLEQASSSPDFGPQVLRARVFDLAELGRVREASALLDTLASLPPAPNAGPPLPPPHFLRILLGVSGLYPADSLPAQLAVLARDTASYAGDVIRLSHLGRGDLRAAETVSLRALPPDTTQAISTAVGMRMATDAYTLLVRGDTANAIAQMRYAIRKAGYSFDAQRRFNSGPLFAYAVALSRGPDTREEGIRRLRSYIFIGSTFTGQAYLALAEALEAQGDPAGAAQAYAHVVRLWENADPHLQPHVKTARDAIARLTGER
jgi:tetratricopeptide (TPR) repeat protein